MNTTLIEQTSKRIKLLELITLTTLFLSLTLGLGLMYIWLPLGITMFSITALSLLAFIIVRIYRWWCHG